MWMREKPESKSGALITLIVFRVVFRHNFFNCLVQICRIGWSQTFPHLRQGKQRPWGSIQRLIIKYVSFFSVAVSRLPIFISDLTIYFINSYDAAKKREEQGGWARSGETATGNCGRRPSSGDQVWGLLLGQMSCPLHYDGNLTTAFYRPLLFLMWFFMWHVDGEQFLFILNRAIELIYLVISSKEDNNKREREMLRQHVMRWVWKFAPLILYDDSHNNI